MGKMSNTECRTKAEARLTTWVNGSQFKEDKTIPIAIVGMGFRGPGDASNIENFYRLLAEGRETWTPIPETKWKANAFYHPDPTRRGMSNVIGGHFFKHDISKFDAPFFSMREEEVACLDPQQRMLLECCYEALEDSGTPLAQTVGSNTAVFVGSFVADFAELLGRDPETISTYHGTNAGNSRAMLSNRLSYFFDFKGPSVAIDTACSASMVAFHLACQALRTGDADQAIVGGSNVILNNDLYSTMSTMGFLSPEGRCYSFDERAQGYGRGEGVGCVLIKPLDKALRDGDTIRAVVRNTGSNQDGKTPGITYPNSKAQESLVRTVYQRCGLDPAETTYVETHGTGTKVGDPAEAAAIGAVFGPGRPRNRPLRIGSVKSNVGHLEGASGITSIIKAVLMLENGVILPSRNFKYPNKRIPFEEWNIQVATQFEPWQTEGPRRLSINSFGYGGSNAHAIIEDASGYLTRHGLLERPLRKSFEMLKHLQINSCNGMGDSNKLNSTSCNRRRIFLCSAFDRASCKDQAHRLAAYLRSRWVDDAHLEDLAYTLDERRSSLPWKVAVAAASADELADALEKEDLKLTKASSKPTVGFVFTGQGAQWAGMGNELVDAFPVYRASLERARNHLWKLGVSWDLLDEISKNPSESRVNEAEFCQPLCSAVQCALVDLLASWDISPAAVMGHSSGELAAAYCIGAMSHEATLTAAYYRGVVASGHSASSKGKARKGAMMAVGLGKQAVEPFIAQLASGLVSVACENSPISVTVSGDAPAIDELLKLLKREQPNVFVRKLLVDVAYHSHHMQEVGDEYLACIPQLLEQPCLSSPPFYSSVTGHLTKPDELQPSYWVSNLLREVKFATALSRMCHSEAITSLVEIGPHSALGGPVRQTLAADTKLREANIVYSSVLVRGQNSVATATDFVAALVARGLSVTLAAVNRCPSLGRTPTVLNSLPTYPWNHTRSFWGEGRLSKAYHARHFPHSDILGVEDRDFNPLEPRWRNIVRLAEQPWMRDHVIQSSVVYPAGGYIAMAIEAAKQHAELANASCSGFMLREVVISQALVIPEEPDVVDTIVTLKPHSESTRSLSDVWNEFFIYSVNGHGRWSEHCRGLIRLVKPGEAVACASNEVNGSALCEERARSLAGRRATFEAVCTREIDVQTFYDSLRVLGLNYGPTFANITAARTAAHVCAARLLVPDTAAARSEQVQRPITVHPAVVDGIIQPLFAAALASPRGLPDPMVPVAIEEVFISDSFPTLAGTKLDIYASNRELGPRRLETSVIVAQESDVLPVMHIKGLTLTSLVRENDNDGVGRRIKKRPGWTIEWDLDPDLLSRDRESLEAASPVPTLSKESCKMVQELEVVILCQIENGVQEQWPPFLRHYARAVHERQAVGDHPLKAPAASEGIGTELCQQCIPFLAKPDLDASAASWKFLESHVGLQRLSQQAAWYIGLLGFKNPELRLLEVGKGCGLATGAVLAGLGGGCDDGSRSCLAQYDLAIDAELGRTRLKDTPQCLSFCQLESKAGPVGSSEGTLYDVILATMMAVDRAMLPEAVRSLRRMLRPGGKLILLEFTVPSLAGVLANCTLSQWAMAKDAADPFISNHAWTDILASTGFMENAICLPDTSDDPLASQSTMIIATAAPQCGNKPTAMDILVVVSNHVEDIIDVVALERYLRGSGFSVAVSTLEQADPQDKLCVVLAELHQPFMHTPNAVQFAFCKKVFLQSRGALWITRGAYSNCPLASVVAGVARTARSERGTIAMVTLDLDDRAPIAPVIAAKLVSSVFTSRFGHDASGQLDNIDMELREVRGQVLLPRLLELEQVTNMVDEAQRGPKLEMQPLIQPNRPLCIDVESPGLLDSIRWVNDDLVAQGNPPHNCVEIEVRAVGINFRDAMMALGQIAVERLGGECSGVVTAVGKDVQDFAVGDRCVALHLGSFATVVQPLACFVRHIPPGMDFETAAALPIIFVTAYYSLFELARVREGETVLIHGAAGGVGQVALELCKLAKVEVFVTVGSKKKKKTVMERFHLDESHVFFSRDNSFAEAVMSATHDRGVDVILNSLAGESHRHTWSCIAPFGRFIELGKRDIFVNTRLEMQHFAKNVTFAAFDLVGLMRERPETCARVWTEVLALIQQRRVRPPSPIYTFSMAEVVKGLRMMQSGKHTGKLVAVVSPSDTVQAIRPTEAGNLFDKNASYLIVGGLGGLGRAIASWMIRRGARNLIFASRRGLAAPSSKEAIHAIQSEGVRIEVVACDVTEAEQVSHLVATCADKLPPIRGLIHSAMVLKDAFLDRMTLEEYQLGVRPKVLGIIGNTSQANYAAANTFLDAFAEYRTRCGLPGVALDLGVITGIGYLAENRELGKRMASQGFHGTDEREFLALIEYAVTHPRGKNGRSQLVSGLGTWSSGSLANFSRPLFAHFRRVTAMDDGSKSIENNLMERIQTLPVDEVADIVCLKIMEKVASQSMISMDDISPSNTLPSHGVDSLAAVEIRNWIFRTFNTTIPILELLSGNSLAKLSMTIAEKLLTT